MLANVNQYLHVLYCRDYDNKHLLFLLGLYKKLCNSLGNICVYNGSAFHGISS